MPFSCGKGGENRVECLYHHNDKPFHEVCKGRYGRKMIISRREAIHNFKEALEELEHALPIHNQKSGDF